MSMAEGYVHLANTGCVNLESRPVAGADLARKVLCGIGIEQVSQWR